MNNSKAVTYLALVLAIILPAVTIGAYLFSRSLPWWMDGGDWLKRVNAILGNSYPMWNQTTLQYPPLYFLLVAGLTGLLGEIRSLELGAFIAYALLPLFTYLFMNELFDDKVIAVAAAWITGFTPIWFEMFGWGGYPDLLGLAFLPLSFLGILRFSKKRSASNLGLLALGSVLIPLTHHLTTIDFIGTLILWGLASLLFDKGPLKAIGIALLVTLVSFGIARLAAGPVQFLTYNPAALSYLLANGSTLLYMFKNPVYLVLIYVVAAATMGLFLLERKYRTQVLLLISWAIIPVIGTQGYLIGIASDYNRVLFFLAQPLTLMVVAPLVYRSNVLGFLKGIGKQAGMKPVRDRAELPSSLGKPLVTSAILLLSISAIVYTPILGSQTVGNINSFYNVSDIYGDASKLQVANFISSHTTVTSVVVAETTMGRWIEGYAQRRVLLNLDPRYLFLSGELERDYAANEILFSNRGIMNGYAWVQDQAPYSQFSPLVSFFIGGEYLQVAVLNDSASKAGWVDTVSGKNISMPLSESSATSSYWIARTPVTSTLGVTYHLGPVQVFRQVTLNATSRVVRFGFNANSTDPTVRLTGLNVSLGPIPGLGLHASTLIGNQTVKIVTDLGNQFYASSSSQAFPYNFSPSSSGTISGWAKVWTDQSGNGTQLYSYDRSGIIKGYGVTDIVVPKQYLAPVGQTENTTLRSLPLYENLLRDPEFKIVYYNERAIVLQVVP